ncbi:hypothetical protein GCM10011515_08820 [Tsuneonella deserti]|uniref:Uncharacterized protein n=1 Tax=Tsuneonella deserti TaxID=2035528 RepID=A0ABQ1S5I3_9SPHN|nr:hypothetical protein GCM10011515_08820 [Tsuneonella deserti]
MNGASTSPPKVTELAVDWMLSYGTSRYNADSLSSKQMDGQVLEGTKRSYGRRPKMAETPSTIRTR